MLFSPYSGLALNPIVYTDKNGEDIYFFDSNNKLHLVLRIPNSPEIGYRIKNLILPEGFFPIVQSQTSNSIDNFLSGKFTPDGIVINLSAKYSLGGGANFGVGNVIFLDGPERFNENRYFFSGLNTGYSVGAGGAFLAAWYTGEKYEISRGSWREIFNTLSLNTGGLVGATFFWSNKANSREVFPYQNSKVTWWGFFFPLPGASEEMGVDWGYSNYSSILEWDWYEKSQPKAMTNNMFGIEDIKPEELKNLIKENAKAIESQENPLIEITPLKP